MAVSPRIFQFQITLDYIRPPVWRRIQVPENYTFRQFHRAIVGAMGWKDYHLHKFTRWEVDIGVLFPGDEESGIHTIDETTVVLNQYFDEPKDYMEYEYDFGDSWGHTILLEKVLPADISKEYPICVDGKRACPPEDCGGVDGYGYLLETIADPDHEEHEERKSWLKEIYGTSEWDAEKFDPKKVVFKIDEPPLYL